MLRLSRTSVTVSGGADFSRDLRFSETQTNGVNYAPAEFRGSEPTMSISVSHSGFNAGITLADIDLGFLSEFLGDAEVGKATFAYVVDNRGRVLASSAKGPEIGKDLSKLPQVAAVMTPDGQPLASGTDAEGHSVLTAASSVPKLGWYVFFEQPTSQALAPIRDQLLRVALLIALGLAVAILAGTVLARRMLTPITALSAGARRLGAGDFSQRIDVHTSRMSWRNSPTPSTAWPANSQRPIRCSRPRSRCAPATSRNPSTSSRCSRKSAARSPPRSISTRCCRRWRRARSKSRTPMRFSFTAMTRRAANST